MRTDTIVLGAGIVGIAVALHLGQQAVEWLRIGNEDRRPHDLADVDVPAAVGQVVGLLDQILEVDDTEHVVDVLPDDRQARGQSTVSCRSRPVR